jgi:hypothetical protein
LDQRVEGRDPTFGLSNVGLEGSLLQHVFGVVVVEDGDWILGIGYSPIHPGLRHLDAFDLHHIEGLSSQSGN